MGFIIDDGKGSGKSAAVSSDNRLNVSSKTNPRAFYISRDDGQTFNLTSIDTSAAAGDFICYLKNDSQTKNAYVEQIHYSAVNTALFKVWVVTGTAAGSSSLTPTNLNLSSGNTADATARGDGAITGLSTVSIIDAVRIQAAEHKSSQMKDSLILGPGDSIAVEYDTGTTGAAEVSIEFHYETIGID